MVWLKGQVLYSKRMSPPPSDRHRLRDYISPRLCIFFPPKWLRVECLMALALKSNGSGLKAKGGGGERGGLTLNLVTCLNFQKTSHDMYVCR